MKELSEHQKGEMMLTIDGRVAEPLIWTCEDLRCLPEEFQVRDVSRLEPSRSGRAVSLRGLIAAVSLQPDADHLTLHASCDGFAVSLPLHRISEKAVLIYELNGSPLPVKQGGPVRLLIPQAPSCKTADVDACANVKFIDRIEFTAGPGQDTRWQKGKS